MKKAYGIVIEEELDGNDRITQHVQQLYADINDARLRRDQELQAIILTRKLVSSPHVDTSHPTKATLICGMFGFPMFVARIIEFIVPTDFQTI